MIFNTLGGAGGAGARAKGEAAGEANKTWVMFSMESGKYYPMVRGGLLAVLRACCGGSRAERMSGGERVACSRS